MALCGGGAWRRPLNWGNWDAWCCGKSGEWECRVAGREEEYPVGWKGDTTKVTGVNQVALLWVVESFESV